MTIIWRTDKQTVVYSYLVTKKEELIDTYNTMDESQNVMICERSQTQEYICKIPFIQSPRTNLWWKKSEQYSPLGLEYHCKCTQYKS